MPAVAVAAADPMAVPARRRAVREEATAERAPAAEPAARLAEPAGPMAVPARRQAVREEATAERAQAAEPAARSAEPAERTADAVAPAEGPARVALADPRELQAEADLRERRDLRAKADLRERRDVVEPAADRPGAAALAARVARSHVKATRTARASSAALASASTLVTTSSTAGPAATRAAVLTRIARTEPVRRIGHARSWARRAVRALPAAGGSVAPPRRSAAR